MRAILRSGVPLLPLLLLLLVAAPGPDVRAGDAAELLRVAVREEGFVAVSPDTLTALPPGQGLSVTRRGHAVLARGSRRDGLVFLAHDVARPTSAWAVYEVRATDVPAAPPPPDAGDAEGTAPPATPLEATRVVDRDTVFGALAGARPAVYAPAVAPTWFYGSILPGRGLDANIDPAGAAAGEDQVLGVDLWSTHVGEVALRATWGGKDLGVARVEAAAGGATLAWAVPANQVPSRSAALRLDDVSPPLPPAVPQDVSHGRGTLWVDRITLQGPVAARIDDRVRVFAAPVGRPFALEVHGAGDVHLALVEPGGRELPVPAAVRRGDRLVLPALAVPAGTRLFAQVGARPVEATPAREAPPPLETAGDAIHLILAVPSLLEPARRLAAHRTRTGTPSAVVPVTDVYAHYGGGEPDLDAIAAFLADRGHRSPPLRYVALAGDATLDRTDMRPEVVIPSPMARTLYNGATAADRLYVAPAGGPPASGPAIGRLPFDDAASMDAWVDRLIPYETSPPADPSRRRMRFITSEGRFGPFIDGLLERQFQTVVTNDVPAAYDIEVTFASPSSARLWPPPQLNEKVIEGFNDGCLFYTYVGHGYAEGFDSLRVAGHRYRILGVEDIPDVACRHTPPAVFVFACTTAIFDMPGQEGIGERLLADPAGPIAYWGATRICHPAANAMLGQALARTMAEDEGRWRLGEIIDRAHRAVLAPEKEPAGMDQLVRLAANLLSHGADADRLNLEASWMYELLGDPATSVAFPRNDVTVEAAWTEDGALVADLAAPLPDGTVLHVSVESPRNRPIHEPKPVADPTDPSSFATIRENHDRVNDLGIAAQDATLAKGHARVHFRVPEDVDRAGLVVKGWTIAQGDVHQGATILAE